MALALQGLDGSPFQAAAATGLRKLVAAMQTDDVRVAEEIRGPGDSVLSVFTRRNPIASEGWELRLSSRTIRPTTSGAWGSG
jgi:hypothetical protein